MSHCHPEIARQIPCDEASDPDRPGPLRSSFGAQGLSPTAPGIPISRCAGAGSSPIASAVPTAPCSAPAPSAGDASDLNWPGPLRELSRMASDQHGCCGPGTGTVSDNCSCCRGCTSNSDNDVCFVCFDSPSCNLHIKCPVCCLTPFSQYTWTAPSTGCRRSAG